MVIIDSTKFGSVTINGRTYCEEDNYIVFWDGEITGLHSAQRYLFGKLELMRILKNPEIIIVGTGDSGLLRVSEEVRRLCLEKKIELIEMVSKQAIEKFNETFNQGGKVVAFIHLTC